MTDIREPLYGRAAAEVAARLESEREAEVRALRRLAELMDEDDARTGNVGIPASCGHRLLWLAIVGSFEAWDREWVRLARTESSTAATAWANGLEARFQRLIKHVYPGGATAHAKSAAEVRTLADAIAEAGEPR